MQTVQTSSCCLLNWAEGGGQGWLPGWARQVGSWIPTTSTKTTSSSTLQASQSNQPSFQTQAASWHLGSGLDLDSDSFSKGSCQKKTVFLLGNLSQMWVGGVADSQTRSKVWYLIFVIFFTRTHFKSWKFYTRKMRKFTTKLPKTVFFWFFWIFFTLSQKFYTHGVRSVRDKYQVCVLIGNHWLKWIYPVPKKDFLKRCVRVSEVFRDGANRRVVHQLVWKWIS